MLEIMIRMNFTLGLNLSTIRTFPMSERHTVFECYIEGMNHKGFYNQRTSQNKPEFEVCQQSDGNGRLLSHLDFIHISCEWVFNCELIFVPRSPILCIFICTSKCLFLL